MLQIDITFVTHELSHIKTWCEASTCAESGAMSKVFMIGFILIGNMVIFLVFLVKYLCGNFNSQQLLLPGIQPFVIGIPLLSSAAVIVLIIFRIFINPCIQRYNWKTVEKETLQSFITCSKMVLIVLFKILKCLVLFLPFTTIFTTLTLFFFSLIPLMLQMIVYPFRVLGLCSYVLAYFALFYIVVFLVTLFWKRAGIQNTSVRVCFLLILPTVAWLLIGMIHIPYSILYNLLISGSLTDNSIVLGVASLLPSLVLSSPLIYLMRNFIIPKLIDLEEQDYIAKNHNGVEMKVMGKTAVHEGSKENGTTDIESGIYMAPNCI